MTLKPIVYTRFENEVDVSYCAFHIVESSDLKPPTSSQSRQRLKTLGVSTIVRYSLYPPWPFRLFV